MMLLTSSKQKHISGGHKFLFITKSYTSIEGAIRTGLKVWFRILDITFAEYLRPGFECTELKWNKNTFPSINREKGIQAVLLLRK